MQVDAPMDDACAYLETPGGRRLPFARRHGLDVVRRALPHVGVSLEFDEAAATAVPTVPIPLEYCCDDEAWETLCGLLLAPVPDPDAADGRPPATGATGTPAAAAAATDADGSARGDVLAVRCCCAAFALELCAFSHADGSHAQAVRLVDRIVRAGYHAVLDAYRARGYGDAARTEAEAARGVLTLWRACRREGVDARPLLCGETLSEAYLRLESAVRARLLSGDRCNDDADGDDAEALYLMFFRAWREPLLECPALWRRAMLDPFALHTAYVPPDSPDVAPDARSVAAGNGSALTAGRASFLARLRAHAGPFASLLAAGLHESATDAAGTPQTPGPCGWACAGGAVLRALLPHVPGDDDEGGIRRARDVDLFVYGPSEEARMGAYRAAVAAAWRCAEATGARPYGVVEGCVATVYAEDCPVYAQVVLSDAESPLEVLAHFDMDAVQCCVDGDGVPLVTPDCLDALRSRTVLLCRGGWPSPHRVFKMVARRGFGVYALGPQLRAQLDAPSPADETHTPAPTEATTATATATPDDPGDTDADASPAKRCRRDVCGDNGTPRTNRDAATTAAEDRRSRLARLLEGSERVRHHVPTSMHAVRHNVHMLGEVHSAAYRVATDLPSLDEALCGAQVGFDDAGYIAEDDGGRLCALEPPDAAFLLRETDLWCKPHRMPTVKLRMADRSGPVSIAFVVRRALCRCWVYDNNPDSGNRVLYARLDEARHGGLFRKLGAFDERALRELTAMDAARTWPTRRHRLDYHPLLAAWRRTTGVYIKGKLTTDTSIEDAVSGQPLRIDELYNRDEWDICADVHFRINRFYVATTGMAGASCRVARVTLRPIQSIVDHGFVASS